MPTPEAIDERVLRGKLAIRTRDPVEMQRYLTEAYRARRFKLPVESAPFRAQANNVHFQRIGFDYFAYDAATNVDFPGAEVHRQFFCLHGASGYRMEGSFLAVTPERFGLAPPGAATAFEYGAGYRELVLRVDPGALRSKLDALIGNSLPRPLTFFPPGKSRNPQQQVLRKLALFCAQELDLTAPPPRLAMAEIEQAILVTFLLANPSNYSFLFDSPAPTGDFRRVRLVESYIEAHWNQPITIENIAEMTGLSARSIFQSFKKAHGLSPMAFVKKVRLERARTQLAQSAPDASIMQIALACGFQSHGHFAQDYKSRFGELPSQTLARR